MPRLCRQLFRGRVDVDSGAAHLVLPGKIVKQLGFPDAGKVKVRYADHRTGKRQRVSNVLLQLLGREAVFTAIVEPKRETALIGAVVLEELDLLVDALTTHSARATRIGSCRRSNERGQW